MHRHDGSAAPDGGRGGRGDLLKMVKGGDVFAEGRFAQHC